MGIVRGASRLKQRATLIRENSVKLHLLIALSLGFFTAESSAQTPTAPAPAGQPEPASHNFTKDMTVYVSDFELEAQNVKVDKGRNCGPGQAGDH